ncbi:MULTISPECIES: sugar phosphate isomerase/epimerase [Raoultella]|uniref:sugar phosphate isomerase/epimerase family protein n=1 Tax=Raoultella TaxID=160674 RepID=UPI0021677260|nr:MULTISPECIES: sugar phosphate isomerase/epimerase family protein [Raoultella]MCS4269614.1 sugar phosphate isomerase/epimerase [Raoultella sp. BIGb0132]MCS4286573.1 sugar phosphate isomerase/epimerase [Raoultella terrigena]
MIKALHGISTHYCNVVSEARIAAETGYDGLEFLHYKLLRYLDNGGSTSALKKIVSGYGLQTVCLNALIDIERYQGEDKKQLLKEAVRLTQVASELECPTIQILAQHGIDHLPQTQILDIMTENISQIADIGQQYGVQYQIEVIAHTKFNTMDQALEVIRRVNKKNVGLVIDFWHLFAAGVTQPEDVAALDPSLIFGVHFCDGRKPVSGEAWDETVLRAYMPGEGQLDVQAWTNAVKTTGFDGVWSAELFSPVCWEMDHYDLARKVHENLTSYTG